MTIIYDVILKRHNIYDVVQRKHVPDSNPYVVVFYDEDREVAIEFMKKYIKQNGFVIEESKGKCSSIADIILRERESTGKVISTTPFHKIFDLYFNRIDKKENKLP